MNHDAEERMLNNILG